MSRPLSISATNLFLECPQKWKLHYIDRVRPIAQMSYFVFGSAIDKALNALLLEDGSPLEAADEELKRLVLETIEFLPNDYDGEIIDDVTKAVLLEKCQSFGYPGNDVDNLATALINRNQSELTDNQRKCLALCGAASLRAKAKLMIEAYKKKVLPSIKRVDSVQQELKWKDVHGNEFIAVLDALVTLVDGTQIVADNKTASKAYEQDSVRMSPQLAIYSKATGMHKAAFFVMEKQIRKNRVKTCSVCANDGSGKRFKTCDAEVEGERCGGEWTETIAPEVNVQIIIDDVSPVEQKMVQDSMSEVANAIKSKCYPKNLKQCEVRYGPRKARCPYYDYCRSGSMNGLETKPEGTK